MEIMEKELIYTAQEKYLFSLITGFFRSKLLAVAIDFDLFTWISVQPRAFYEIQKYLNLEGRPARIFLDALANIDLIKIKNGSYQNSDLSNNYLVKRKIQYQGDTVKLFDSLYTSCADLKEVIQNNSPNNHSYSYFFDKMDKEIGEYSKTMDNTNTIPAMALCQFYDFSNSKRVLDIGGGYGRTCMTIVSQYPKIEAILFDLPQVCEKAKEVISKSWLSHRIKIYPGDFFQDEFPDGVDTILMVRITHDWSINEIKNIFQKAFNVLPSGGKLIIYETFKNYNQSTPDDVAIVSILLLLISPNGECRSFEEIKKILNEIGFVSIEFIPTIHIYSLVVAVKP